MAGDKKFIPGICNFCNRWCDRCSKTQNCLSFANEQLKKEIDVEQTNSDAENKKFWNATEEILKLDSNDLTKPAKEKSAEKVSQSNLILFAQRYEKTVSSWLSENSFILKEKAKLVVAKYDNKILMLSDATDVINWYSSFISKRILRSLNDLEERKTENYEDGKNPFRDNIGSAKNTIIACDHSMAAFLLVYPQLEKHQDKIQLFISDLNVIKNHMLELFPKSMQFKRPGFDT